MKNYDAIVIGGGINGLSLATLLSKKNQSVLLIEARNNIGGMASSKKMPNGFKYNLIYDYIRWIDPRLINLLNLEKYGLEFMPLEPLRISLDEKGNHIEFFSDPQKTVNSIARHSKEDSAKWIDFTRHVAKLTNFLESLYQICPPSISDLGVMDALNYGKMLKPFLKHGSRGLVDVLRTIPMMMPELLDEWFTSDLLQGSLAASGTFHLNQGPYSAATGLNFLHQHVYSNGRIHNAFIAKGGMENLPKAIYEAAKDGEVMIKTNCKVTSIHCKDDICYGVTTSNGKTYHASKVISALDPNHTCIKLIEPHNLSSRFKTQLKNIKYRGSTARIHFMLNKCPKIHGVSNDQMKTIFSITPSIKYIEHAYDDAKYGNISENPCIEFTIPSLFNASHAPSKKHILSTTVQYAPHMLNDDISKMKLLNNVTKILEKHISNFSDLVEDTRIMLPIDMEASLGLTEGNTNQGEMTLDQFFFMRPTISTAQYATPIQNLYFCGPGTHPGGGLHGANAVNALNEILKDSS